MPKLPLLVPFYRWENGSIPVSLRFWISTVRAMIWTPGSLAPTACLPNHPARRPASQVEKEEINTSARLPGSGLEKTVFPPTPRAPCAGKSSANLASLELNAHVSLPHLQAGSALLHSWNLPSGLSGCSAHVSEHPSPCSDGNSSS